MEAWLGLTSPLHPGRGGALRIILEAVDAGRKRAAEVELWETAHSATPPLIAIMVVDDVHEAFGRHFPRVDLVNLPEGGQIDEMRGLARTFAIRIDGGLISVIGVNAGTAPDAFVRWRDEERPCREHTIWHEMTHVQDMAIQVHAAGITAFVVMFRSEDTAEIARHNAHIVWWEYHAHRHVTASMTEWRMGERLWSHVHALNQGYHEQLRDYLNGLPGSARWDPGEARAVLDHIPYLWAAVMGFEDAGVPIPKAYEQTPGYKRALEPGAMRIRALLHQMHANRGEYRGDLLADLSAALLITRKSARKLATESGSAPT